MKKTGEVGTCAVCGRSIKLVGNRLGTSVVARHGHHRYGLGISGRACPGASYQPAEVSLLGLTKHIADVERRLVRVVVELGDYAPEYGPHVPRLWVNSRAEGVRNLTTTLQALNRRLATLQKGS